MARALLNAALALLVVCAVQAAPRQRRGVGDCGPPTPCFNGGTCTDNGGTYTCACAFGFQGDQCELNCGKIDVVLILDESGSITLDNWQNAVVPFAVGVASKLPIHPDYTRLGCVRFHTEAEIFFEINEGGLQDNAAVESKLQSLDNQYQEGWTNTSAGLYFAREYLFTKDTTHDRPDVDDLILLFTDGKSNKAIPGSDAIKEGNLNHAAGFTTYVIGVGGNLNQSEVEAIASDPDSKYLIPVADFSAMDTIIDEIVAATCAESMPPDPCLSSPCQNGGTCTNNLGTMVCDCATGYTGNMCQTDIDDCESTPCMNGATCTDKVNGYDCTCAAGFTGPNCDSTVDFCAPDPATKCNNGGTCVSGATAFTCDCVPGYTGDICQTDIDDCESTPCKNGATCTDKVNDYQCDCPPGYSGKDCDQLVDHCQPDPTTKCQNGGTCVSGTTDFTCDCVPGYTGATCQTDIDDCESTPCMNGATCTDKVNDYQCDCAPGYSGKDCDQTIDFCQPDPMSKCQNGGTCVSGTTDYTCDCPAGYTGNTCQTDVDDCLSGPCMNGATCVDKVNGYQCTCAPGFSGKDCDLTIDNCQPDPASKCQNGGTCISGLTDYTCDCVPGYTGASCQTDIDECLSGPCMNGATCTDKVNSYQCDCAPGYSGMNCDQTIDNCQPDPMSKCLNGGTCVSGTTDYTCTCVPGYTGDMCQTDIDECLSGPCMNGATCVDKVNSYQCTCAPGYSGMNCDLTVDNCQPDPMSKCLNGGTCVSGLTDYTCVCVPGYTGDKCQTDIDECLSGPCMNGATCVDKVNAYQCTCAPGYSGTNCDLTVDNCQPDPMSKCLNGGTCVSGLTDYTCVCVPGYTGDKCQTDIDDCASGPCKNNAMCADKLNDYTCTCTPGYSGKNCDQIVDYCQPDPTTKCLNGGTCVSGTTDYSCVCVPGFTGSVCQTDIDECLSGPCKNGATCSDMINAYTCTCPLGFMGPTCEQPIDFCAPDPSSKCLNAGTCLSTTTGYTCICQPGYTGLNCQTDVNECASVPCKNGGACTNMVNSYSCTCLPGYSGANCEIVDHCKKYSTDPCMNGGTCVSGADDFSCVCTAMFTGKVCQTPIDHCASGPCNNGATCLNTAAGYSCVCATGFMGPTCDVVDDPCHPMDICIIVDTSISVDPTEWDELRRFLQDTVNTLEIGPTESQVGFVTYSHFAEVSAALNRYATKQEVITGIWNDIRHLNASTKTDLGIAKAANGCFNGPGDRADYDNLAIIATDGKSHTSITAASAALRNVAKVSAVGIDGADVAQLQEIVNYDDNLWFKVNTFGELKEQVSTLMQSSCNPCSPSPCQNGGTCTATAGASFDCACTTGWTGSHCHEEDITPECQALDICFIIDTSISVFPDEWVDLRQFIEQTVDTLTIGPTDSQVGFVSYSHYATVAANLNRYSTKAAVKSGIWTDIPHLNASTKTDLGLAAGANGCFNGAGDRAGYDNLAIIATDGRSHTAVGTASKNLRDVAKVVAVGIDGADEAQLAEMVDNDAALWFKVNSFKELSGQVSNLMKSSCNPCSPNPCNNGGTCSMTSGSTGFVCQCPTGFSGSTCAVAPNTNQCRDMDICFVVDTSISVFPDEWIDLRQFIQDTVSTLEIGPTKSQVGYVTYSHIAELSAPLNRYTSTAAAIAGAWSDIRHLNASTKTDQGLALGANGCFGGPGDRADFDNLCIVLTDGRSHTDVNAASAALRAVAKVVAVGIDGADETQLSQMVNGDSSLWFKVPTFKELAGQVATLMESSCGDPCNPNQCQNGGTCSGDAASGVYTCTCPAAYTGSKCQDPAQDVCDPNPCANGGTCASTGVTTFVCICNPGFVGSTCQVAQIACKPIDICFIIDTSVSVFPDEWNDLRQFIADVISGMVVGPNDAQIGYVTYSHTAELSAPLNRYTSTQAAITGIWNDVRHLNASTKTDLGLSLGANGCFGGPGDRADKENLGIVLTDGRSHTSITAASAALRGVSKVIAMGIDGAVESQLQEIAGDDTRWFKVPTFSELAGEVSALMQASCDPCDPSPCQNNGVCVGSTAAGTYQCSCPSGFSGTDCEISDPCQSTPCMNGGQCISSGGAYTCQCTSMFTGSNCQSLADPCNPSPCTSSQQCIASGTSYICQEICPSQFYYGAPECTTHFCDNSPQPCGPNHDFCENLGAQGYYCGCLDGSMIFNAICP